MARENDVQIRPKIIKKGGHSHHGGAWKVAYADFVTAMMALFIVLWILSQGPEVRQAVAAYFSDPSGVPDVTNTANNLLKEQGAGLLQGVQSPMMGHKDSGKSSGKSFAPTIVEKNSSNAAEKAIDEMKQALSEIKPSLSKIGDINDAVTVQSEGDGIRIELIEKMEGNFFQIGSAVPTADAQKIIQTVVGSLGNSYQHVTVEGHTDARPYYGGESGYSNFELSCDRANTVRRLMTSAGTPAEKFVEVKGFADRKPKNPDDPYDQVNRRVSILLTGIEASQASLDNPSKQNGLATPKSVNQPGKEEKSTQKKGNT